LLGVIKDLLLILSSAVLLILSLPGFNLEFLAWFGFVPLFFALKNKSRLPAFLLAYFTGVIFWLGTIYWLIHVTLLGMILLVLYLALYFGIFGLILSTMDHGPWTMDLFFIPSFWVMLEYARSHLLTGFGWALLGYSQYLNLPVIQIADITGVWGVSFLVVLVNVMLYRLISQKSPALRDPALDQNVEREKVKSRKSKIPMLILACSLWLLAYGYGFLKLHGTRYPVRGTSIKISVIQGNIRQELKWQPDTRDFILKKYLDISHMAAKDRPDLLIWPEAAMPVILEAEPAYFEEVSRFVKETRIPLLMGAVTLRDNAYYNSAVLVDTDGSLARRYDKLHLVPFGEYIPLRKILTFLETIVPIGDIAPGKEYTVFRAYLTSGPGHGVASKFSVLICFEDIFPELSRAFIKRGAHFLVNITNDAWYKKTAASYQHLQASVFRAVENRVFLVRSANTGISGFISPKGEIISLVRDQAGKEIFIDGYKTQEILISKRPLSFYTRFGDWFVLLCIFIMFCSIIIHYINPKFKA
jgi:apolipoprotein N-acyltransferase